MRQTHDGAGYGRLTAARLAYQAKCLASMQVETDAINCTHLLVFSKPVAWLIIVFSQILNLQQRFSVMNFNQHCRGPRVSDGKRLPGLSRATFQGMAKRGGIILLLKDIEGGKGILVG